MKSFFVLLITARNMKKTKTNPNLLLLTGDCPFSIAPGLLGKSVPENSKCHRTSFHPSWNSLLILELLMVTNSAFGTNSCGQTLKHAITVAKQSGGIQLRAGDLNTANITQ
jgi:hypothetical protein